MKFLAFWISVFAFFYIGLYEGLFKNGIIIFSGKAELINVIKFVVYPVLTWLAITVSALMFPIEIKK